MKAPNPTAKSLATLEARLSANEQHLASVDACIKETILPAIVKMGEYIERLLDLFEGQNAAKTGIEMPAEEDGLEQARLQSLIADLVKAGHQLIDDDYNEQIDDYLARKAKKSPKPKRKPKQSSRPKRGEAPD